MVSFLNISHHEYASWIGLTIAFERKEHLCSSIFPNAQIVDHLPSSFNEIKTTSKIYGATTQNVANGATTASEPDLRWFRATIVNNRH